MFFKKWKERIEGEIRADLVEHIGRTIVEMDKRFLDYLNGRIDYINKEKKEWDDFLVEQALKFSRQIAEQKTHNTQIERGLKMCEESLEIIKKLLEERK